MLKSTAPLPAHDGSGSACVQHAHREYAPPENASECAPTVRPSAESFLIYSGSTAVGNFEIGSSHDGFWLKNGLQLLTPLRRSRHRDLHRARDHRRGSSRGGLKCSCRGAAARPLASTLSSNLADQTKKRGFGHAPLLVIARVPTITAGDGSQHGIAAAPFGHGDLSFSQPKRPRSCGCVKSSAGPIGTMPVGLT